MDLHIFPVVLGGVTHFLWELGIGRGFGDF